MEHTVWKEEITNITTLLNNGESLETIGKRYGVTKQRLYQVMTKYGISTGIRERKNFLRDKEPKFYWLNRMLSIKKIDKKDRLFILETFNIPDICPMLGIKLNYDGAGKEGWTREDCSPSLDRIDSSKEYTIDNIQIISWRANRIKNDSSPEELLKIASYMIELTKNKLQV